MDAFLYLLLFAYTIWGFYSGYQLITGRLEWLDEKKFPNILVKILCSIVIGYVIGAVRLIVIIFTFIASLL